MLEIKMGILSWIIAPFIPPVVLAVLAGAVGRASIIRRPVNEGTGSERG